MRTSTRREQNETAIGQAMENARRKSTGGGLTDKQRLDALLEEAVRTHPTDNKKAARQIIHKVQGPPIDVGLLWEIAKDDLESILEFMADDKKRKMRAKNQIKDAPKPVKVDAHDRALPYTAKASWGGHLADSASSGRFVGSVPARPSAALKSPTSGIKAVKEVAARSLLDIVQIRGKALGDWIPEDLFGVLDAEEATLSNQIYEVRFARMVAKKATPGRAIKASGIDEASLTSMIKIAREDGNV